MNKKSALFLLLLLVSNTITFSQETETALIAPDDWRKEIIHFPIEFAEEIDFVGFEDLRLSPGWSDSTSPEFWTFSFAWYIDEEPAMTESLLAETFDIYYTGLTHDSGSTEINETMSLFLKTDDGFIGKMRMYDSFFSKTYLTLNIEVKETFCAKSNKQIVQCNISPKPFDHSVWKIFDTVTPIECD